MFNAFERAVAFRYLRARKGERFVSIIGMFSLIGIALGVATLIIVMAVMNGFREELLGRILGLNGHIGVYAANAGDGDLRELIAAVESLHDDLGSIIARYTPTIGDRDFARKVRSAIA